MGSKSQTSTTSSQAPAFVENQLQSLYNQANTTVANNPYQAYTGQLVAGQNDLQNEAATGLGQVTGGAIPYVQQAGAQQGQGFDTTQSAVPYLQAGAGIANSALPYYQAGANTIQSATQPGGYESQAAGLAQTAAGPLNVGAYESPYTNQVVNATQAQFNNQNAQSANTLLGQGIQAGNAFGGDRAGVAQAALAGQEQTAQAPVIAGLENQGYQTALQAAENQAGQQNTAASTIGGLGGQQITAGSALGNVGAGVSNVGSNIANVGTGIANTGSTLSNEASNIANIGEQFQQGNLNGFNAQLAGGTQQQTTAQNQLNAQYAQWQAQQAFPYQQLSWLTGIDTGAAGSAGGTSSTTGPAPSLWNSIIGGASTLGGAAILSDRRLKEDIRKIGKTFDGKTLYSFKYKGSPTTHVGLMAQDEEKSHPEHVHEIGGVKHVDYEAATRAAADKGHFASGGLVGYDNGGGVAAVPWSGGWTPFPHLQTGHGRGIPNPPNLPNQNNTAIETGSKGLADAFTKSAYSKAGPTSVGTDTGPVALKNPTEGLAAKWDPRNVVLPPEIRALNEGANTTQVTPDVAVETVPEERYGGRIHRDLGGSIFSSPSSASIFGNTTGYLPQDSLPTTNSSNGAGGASNATGTNNATVSAQAQANAMQGQQVANTLNNLVKMQNQASGGLGGAAGTQVSQTIGPTSYGGEAGPQPLVGEGLAAGGTVMPDLKIFDGIQAPSGSASKGMGIPSAPQNPGSAGPDATSNLNSLVSMQKQAQNGLANLQPGAAVTGDIGPSSIGSADLGPMPLVEARGGRIHYDDGGTVPDFSDRIQPAVDAISDGTFDPQRDNKTTLAPPPKVPLPRRRPEGLAPADPALDINNTDPRKAFRLGGDDSEFKSRSATPEGAAKAYAENNDNGLGPVVAADDGLEAKASKVKKVADALMGQGSGVAPAGGSDPSRGIPGVITGRFRGDAPPPGQALGYNGGPTGQNGGLAPPAGQPPAQAAPQQPSGVAGGIPQPAPEQKGLIDSIIPHLSPEAGIALMRFGLGMMASKAPNAAQAAGEAGIGAIGTYQEAVQAKADELHKQAQEQVAQTREQREAQSAALNQQIQQRNLASSDLIPDPKNPGNLIPNPAKYGPSGTLAKAAEINNKDKWGAIGSYTTPEDKLHPVLMNSLTGETKDGVTGQPLGKDTAVISKTTGKQIDPAKIKYLADGVESGRLPPELRSMYGVSSDVQAELEKRGFDLNKALLESTAARKQISSLNGPQQIKFLQLASSVNGTIGEVNTLSKQMQLSGIPLLNRAELWKYMQTEGNSENGQLAARYIGAVNTLKEEFANLANGGYAPTEPAWKLANEQINGDYGVKQLGAALNEVQRLINYRVEGAKSIGGFGPGTPNRYTGATGEPPAAHTATPPAPPPMPLTDWLAKAREKNPGVSDADLTAAYNHKYGQ